MTLAKTVERHSVAAVEFTWRRPQCKCLWVFMELNKASTVLYCAVIHPVKSPWFTGLCPTYGPGFPHIQATMVKNDHRACKSTGEPVLLTREMEIWKSSYSAYVLSKGIIVTTCPDHSFLSLTLKKLWVCFGKQFFLYTYIWCHNESVQNVHFFVQSGVPGWLRILTQDIDEDFEPDLLWPSRVTDNVLVCQSHQRGSAQFLEEKSNHTRWTVCTVVTI